MDPSSPPSRWRSPLGIFMLVAGAVAWAVFFASLLMLVVAWFFIAFALFTLGFFGALTNRGQQVANAIEHGVCHGCLLSAYRGSVQD